MKWCFYIYLFIFLINSYSQINYYISPLGDDQNPGTIEKPFQTIYKARNYILEHHLNQTENITVFLRGGTYYLDRTIDFYYPNSGQNGYTITYKAFPNETPILSAGKIVTGWKPYKNGIWTTQVDINDFRQFYINGKAAVRATGNPIKTYKNYGNYTEYNAAAGYITPDKKLLNWKNIGDVEIIYVMTWCHMIGKIDTVFKWKDSTVILMKQPLFYLLNTKPGRTDKYIERFENALELLDEPNEWYFDKRKKQLYYMPPPDINIHKSTCIVPTLERLITFKGTPENTVHHITFDSITFCHGTWLQPSEIGHPEIQANFTAAYPGYGYRAREYIRLKKTDAIKSTCNIGLDYSHHIIFRNCTITNMGGGGIDIARGSKYNVIEHCVFKDIAGNGIQIGDVLEPDHHPRDTVFIVKGNTIRNSTIDHCAWQYQGGVGIFIGYTDSTTIEHNEICNLSYTGISVGWGWGEFDFPNYSNTQFVQFMRPTIARQNKILNNHIHHVMQIRSDGGGIYTLGRQPGTLISGNYLHNNPKAHDIYLDEGSAEITVENNVIIPFSDKNLENIIKLHNPPDELKNSCIIRNNIIIPPATQDEKALEIINNAGPKK